MNKMEKSIRNTILVLICIFFIASVTLIGCKSVNITDDVDENGESSSDYGRDTTNIISVFGDMIDKLGHTDAVGDDIEKGIEPVGCTSIVYEIKDESSVEEKNYSDAEIEDAMSILRDRVDKMGYTGAVVERYGEKTILIEIPGVEDPEEAIQEIGSTAKLSFVDSNGNEVLTGDDVVRADAVFGGDYDGNGVSEWFISL